METIPSRQARIAGFALLAGVLGLLLLVHYTTPHEKPTPHQAGECNFINLT